MKNPALQRKNLYNKNEVEYSHKMAIYQGMAMVFVALEWHYGCRNGCSGCLTTCNPSLRYRRFLASRPTYWSRCSILSRITRLILQKSNYK